MGLLIQPLPPAGPPPLWMKFPDLYAKGKHGRVALIMKLRPKAKARTPMSSSRAAMPSKAAMAKPTQKIVLADLTRLRSKAAMASKEAIAMLTQESVLDAPTSAVISQFSTTASTAADSTADAITRTTEHPDGIDFQQ